MAATTTPRGTPYKELGLMVIAVAAGALLLEGTIACANADGYAVEGSTDTDLTYLGRFEQAVDNRLGDDGDLTVEIRTHAQFCWDNSTTDPVTQASIGKSCWIVDNQTVAATSGTNTRSKAGVVVGIDSNGVWVA